MDTLLSLLVVSTLPQLVVSVAPSVAPYRAVIEQVSGSSRIFSGETVRLRCSVPEDKRSTWDHLWFRGNEQVFQGDNLILWNIKVKHSGKYYCQGVRDTVVGLIHTFQSLPVEIDVDGGWAILQVPPHPVLVGETMSVTCRIRGNPKLKEVFLYRNGVEVMRQNGSRPHFHLANVNLKDRGFYSCRATWDVRRRSHSVESVATEVSIQEVLTQPILEVVTKDPLIPANMMRLVCHLQYNAHAPAPPVHFYFYKNEHRLGTASSENNEVVKQSPGHYRCKARVPELGLLRWSEPKTFGEVTAETVQRIPPSLLQPRAPRPLPPAAVTPILTSPPPPRPTPQQPTAAPTSPPATDAPLMPTQPLAEPQQPNMTVLSNNQTAPPMFVEMSGDFPESTDESDVELAELLH